MWFQEKGRFITAILFNPGCLNMALYPYNGVPIKYEEPYIFINKISIGSLIAFYSYFQVIVPSIQFLSNFNADLIKYKEIKQGIKNIFNIQREIDKSNFSLPKEFDIVFENVSLRACSISLQNS